jgi:hypothetical protein
LACFRAAQAEIGKRMADAARTFGFGMRAFKKFPEVNKTLFYSIFFLVIGCGPAMTAHGSLDLINKKSESLS